ncbi:MAG: autotransporter-associated beta strand repeat-containing protein, partial [Rubrivivax sp.]|nr:autotransporter-associated beta strand repeat-containing protein [Rubrivivax sp.]
DGIGVLTAANYLLTGGIYNSDLGTGNLTSSGDSVLNGTSRAESLQILGGSLTLGQAGRLLAAPAVTVDGGALLTLGGNETFGSLSGAGMLNLANHTLRTGSGGNSQFAGTLAGGSGSSLVKDGASTFTLAGTSSQTGNVTVNAGNLAVSGSLASTSMTVNAGTLSLLAADRLADLSAVTVATGASLQLAGDDTVGSLTLAGLLAGSGRLSAAQYTLAGGTAQADLGAGTLTSTGSSTLTGRAAAADLTVQSGTLTLSTGARLSGAPALNIAAGATLQIAGDETASSLQLAGTLAGNGTLSASTYALADGTANANLGAGSLTATGTSRLAGSSAALAVAVTNGTLTLGGADRLADSANVDVAAGATLVLTGTDRVSALHLAGTLGGTGTLTAASYALAGGSALAALGTGSLTSTGSSSLVGSAGVENVRVVGGTLTLGSASRWSATPTVTVDAGARLTLGGAETVGALAGGGTLGLGSATLTTGDAANSTFAGVIEGSGGLAKRGAGRLTLTGASTYTGPTEVAGGTLELGNGGSSGSLTTSTFVVDGVLRFNRSDAVTLSQAVSGSGGLTQAGSGRLTLQNGNKSFTGATRVEAGELATSAAGDLAPGSDLSVATGALLTLTGAQTARSIETDGRVTISANLSATNAIALRGGVTVANNLPVVLSAQRID